MENNFKILSTGRELAGENNRQHTPNTETKSSVNWWGIGIISLGAVIIGFLAYQAGKNSVLSEFALAQKPNEKLVQPPGPIVDRSDEIKDLPGVKKLKEGKKSSKIIKPVSSSQKSDNDASSNPPGMHLLG